MGSKLVALLVAVIGVIALAAAGVYLYRHHGAAPGVETVATGEKPVAEQPKPAESPPAESGSAEPTAVPSFDVVRIEPTGEGVLAGRAEPGWTITLESGGGRIAETKVDEEGAWSVVLDKPLAAGAHSITLRATSPDGTQALTGQQPVQVAVGEPEGAAAVAQKEAAPATSEQPAEVAAPVAPTPGQQAAELQAVPGQPEPVVPDENAPPPERPKPPVRIGKLDYQDSAPDSGKISMSGVGNPNAHIFFFFDDKPLGDVVIGDDGAWVFEIEKKLGEGEHSIRADIYDEKTGMVAGRASLRLGREPEAAKTEAAQQEPTPETVPAEPEAGQAGGAPSGQPEPIYPNGRPEEATEPSFPSVAAEPQDLSSQPQPVVPEEQAAAEAPVTVSQQDLSSQPQPVPPGEAAPPLPEAAPAEPSAPVAVVPANESKPMEAKKARVVFKSVDYRDVGAESGKVSLSGTGEPGARVFLYFDQTPLGEVSVGSDGTWVFEVEKKLAAGEHSFRADSIDRSTGTVVGSASVGIARLEPPKEAAAAPVAPSPSSTPQAAAPPPAAKTATPPQPESKVAAAEEAQPAVSAKKRKPHRPRVYTVRRGDTLWEIAESYYGGGWHYRAIVRDNKRMIKNPNRIYPKQKFHIPSGK